MRRRLRYSIAVFATAVATYVRADVSTTASFSPPQVGTYDSTTFAVAIHNSSATTVSNVSFHDVLPSGLAIQVAQNEATCGGTFVVAGNDIALTGASVAPDDTCTVAVTLYATEDNIFPVTTDVYSASSLVSTATATLTSIWPPLVEILQFTPFAIDQTEQSTFSLQLRNYNVRTTLTGASLDLTLPTGLSFVNTVQATCGGRAVIIDSTSIHFADGVFAPKESCGFSLTAAASEPNIYQIDATFSSANGGSSSPYTNLHALSPPYLSKFFGINALPLGGTTVLRFFVGNNNPADPMTNVRLTDHMPDGVRISDPANVVLTGCSAGTTVTTTADQASIQTDIAPLGHCEVRMDVYAAAAGYWVNTTDNVLFRTTGVGESASASLNINNAPLIEASFSEPTLPRGGTAILALKFTNPNPAITIVLVSASDLLPQPLYVDTPSIVTNTCGGNYFAIPRTPFLSVGDFNLAPLQTCTATFRVTAECCQTGTITNQVTVETRFMGVGNTASASIDINTCDYTLGPPAVTVGPEGASGTVSVTPNPATCAWWAASSAPWLTSTSRGTGNGTVSYSIAPNTVEARDAALRIGNHDFAVHQQSTGPGSLVATAQTIHSVQLSWLAPELPPGAFFEIWRNDGHSPTLAPLLNGTTTLTSFPDNNVAENTAYVYAVRTVDGPTLSPFSNHNIAITRFLSDDPFVPSTTIQLAHLQQHRDAIDFIRHSAGFDGYGWAEAATPGLAIKESHFTEFATALEPVWTPLGITPTVLPTVYNGTLIEAANFSALRGILK